MESANHGDLDDVPLVRWLNRSQFRRVFPQRKVRPEAVVVREVTSNEPAQMVLDHHVVETVSA